MLMDKDVFDDTSSDMIMKWYFYRDRQANHKEIMIKYHDQYKNHKSTPFNGIVIGIGKRIIKYLNRFELIGSTGKTTFWIIPFQGWHENYLPSRPFVWKLRDELVQAIEKLQLFENENIDHVEDELESIIYEGYSEGKRVKYYTTRYERNQKNRGDAIRIHGLSCCVCDFNFEKFYGALGKNYIEVHHRIPLGSKDEEIIVNPNTDLVCICSNCHKMLHRKRDRVLEPNELKSSLTNNTGINTDS